MRSHIKKGYRTTHESWRAEGRIFGRMLVISIACATWGYGTGMRGALDWEVIIGAALCLTLVTLYALTLGPMIGASRNMNVRILMLLVVLWSVWFIAALETMDVTPVLLP